MTDKRQVDVVEQFEEDPVRGNAEGIVVGENGKIWMQGKVLGGFMVAGQPACIELQVKNHSTKKVCNIAVELTVLADCRASRTLGSPLLLPGNWSCPMFLRTIPCRYMTL